MTQNSPNSADISDLSSCSREVLCRQTWWQRWSFWQFKCSRTIMLKEWPESATTLVSVWNTRVFRTALTPLMEHLTLWRRITCFPSPRRQVVLHPYLHYFAPGMWWHIRTIRMTCVLHSSQGLQLCCSHSQNALWCLCLSSADSHILPLRNCYISDAVLAPYMFSFEIWSSITIQSSLRIHCLPFYLLCHYCILQVWNMQSNLHTL